MSIFSNEQANEIRAWNKMYIDIINPDYGTQNTIGTRPIILLPNSGINKNIFGLNQLTNFYLFNGLNKTNETNETNETNIQNSNQIMFTPSYYINLNNNDKTKKALTKYYYYKILDKWIYKEMESLLAFVNIEDDKPHLIKTLENYDVIKSVNESKKIKEKKIEYLEKTLITKNMVKHVLNKICKENNINWYDLNKHEKKIKIIFSNFLLEKFKKLVKEK